MALANSNGNGSRLAAVLYLRMSSEEQTESIPAQRAELTKYAASKGYRILREYVDAAISGDDTENRTEFLHMRDDSAGGEFEVVLCWDQDRFGRFDPLDAGFWIYPFRRAGVRLETIGQGRIDWEDLTGQLIYSVNQLGKAQYLRDLSRNTTRGLLASAKAGRGGTGGSPPLGYDSRNGEVSIVEDEAKLVRWIFAEYLKPAGSLRSVAAELTRQNVKLPRGGNHWEGSSVRVILQRRKYTGTFVWGTANVGKYFSWRDGEIIPRRKADRYVDSTPITHANHFEAIIDQETFDRAQAKLAASKTKTSRRSARQYLLSGLLKCGDCGGSMGTMYRAKGPLYYCRVYHQTGRTGCYSNTIKEAPLVACIVRKIQERYLSAPALDRLRKALAAEQAEAKPRPRDLSKLRREIEALDRKIDQGADRVLDAPVEIVPTLYHKLEQLKVERDRLKVELDALASRETRPDRQDDSEIDQAIEALQRLGEALQQAKTEDTKELLSSLVSKIELHFDHAETTGGRKTSTFSHGLIHIRPDAGAVRAIGNSTHLNKTPPTLLQVCTLRFTEKDLRQAG